MKYIKLPSGTIEEDRKKIKEAIDKDISSIDNAVFLYDSEEKNLYDYINSLYHRGKGLSNAYIYKFKICYEKKDLDITLSYSKEKDKHVSCMSKLIELLDDKKQCKIIVENNDRVHLAFIIQQLIFIQYPLKNIDILLREEERDADKSKRFMEKSIELSEGCEKAISRLEELNQKVKVKFFEQDTDGKTRSDMLKDIEDSLESCKKIKSMIDKARNVELKIAVVATKKTGKSVIVNNFIEEEIAPTSLEVATPNTCIYKKSKDFLYHLQSEGSEEQKFENCEAIYDAIENYFHNAQNDSENKYTIPDMNIMYPTNKDNFSSYTIFDTPGPDAAGTNHRQSAMKSLQKADVAIFALDYSKYINDPEEAYLKEVKDIFRSQRKFHSLIFAVNKFDLKFTDCKAHKSFVATLDLFKRRLAEINKEYGDCILFPTSAKEYFYIIEAKKSGVEELNKVIKYEDMRELGKNRGLDCVHELDKIAYDLNYYVGIDNFSYDVFEKDSGMPVLMNYVNYVTTSKAREEIVNNITYEIDSKEKELKSIINYISNLEKFIAMDEKKIDDIKEIITRYADSVEKILSTEIKEEELKSLDDNALLKSSKGKYEPIIKSQSESIEQYDKIKIADGIYYKAVESIWNKIERNKTERMDENEIDEFFSRNDFANIINKFFEERFNKSLNDSEKQMSILGKELKKIVDNRQKKLEEESKKCRAELSKENVECELPEIPVFEFKSKMRRPDNFVEDFEFNDFHLYERISQIFKKDFWGNIGIYFLNFFRRDRDKEDIKYKLNQIEKRDFLKLCDVHLKDSLEKPIFAFNMVEKFKEKAKKFVIDRYIRSFIDELNESFNNQNESYGKQIKTFRTAVDDSDMYKAKIDLFTLRKNNIKDIEDSISDFMSVWNIIITDMK